MQMSCCYGNDNNSCDDGGTAVPAQDGVLHVSYEEHSARWDCHGVNSVNCSFREIVRHGQKSDVEQECLMLCACSLTFKFSEMSLMFWNSFHEHCNWSVDKV